jgi:Tfp pilus assembly protein PilF
MEGNGTDEPRRARGAWWLGIAAAALVGLPVFVLWGSLANAYQLDDVYRIEQNVEIEHVRPVLRHFTDPRTSTSLPSLEQYRPLLPLSLSLTAWAGDRLGVERVVAHRAGNLTLHVLTGLLVWALLAELLRRAPPRVCARRRPLAFAGALSFALHPVAGIPVQYLCSRDLGLANLFLVAALLVYARMRRSARGDTVLGWACTLALLAVSLSAKTNGAAFFGVVLAFELTLAGGRLREPGVWVRAAAAGAVTLALFLWTRALGFSDAAQLVDAERSPLAYGLTELKVHLFYYLRNAVWPLYLRPLPDVAASGAGDWRAILGAAFVAGSLVLAWRARRRRPELAFAVCAYWVLFAPTSSLIPLRSFATDYRQVPSLVFLTLWFVAGPLAALPARAAAAVTVAAAAGLGVLSQRQGEVWRTPLTLWGDAVAKGTTGRGHQNFAFAVQDVDPVLAEEHYQIALRENPGDVYSRINLGLLRLNMGRITDGMAEVERAVQLRPDWAITYRWLAFANRRTGARENAARASARAAELDPRDPDHLYWAGYDLQALGEHAAALPWLERLEREFGAFRDSAFRLAWAYQEVGRPDRAIPLYESFLERSPDHVQALFNLAHARKTRGDFAGAAPGFERVLELSPRYRECHLHLAECYERLGDSARAAPHRAAYEAALRERGVR